MNRIVLMVWIVIMTERLIAQMKIAKDNKVQIVKFARQ